MFQAAKSNTILVYLSLVIPALFIPLPTTTAVLAVQDPTVLQQQAIERIDRCAAQLRKTGITPSALDERRGAEDESSRSQQEFVKRQDWSNAALGLDKMASRQRWQDRCQQAKNLDQQAHDLARRANHKSFQVKTLIGQARAASIGLKDYDTAITYYDLIHLSVHGKFVAYAHPYYWSPFLLIGR
jgi:hypothetical protein